MDGAKHLLYDATNYEYTAGLLQTFNLNVDQQMEYLSVTRRVIIDQNAGISLTKDELELLMSINSNAYIPLICFSTVYKLH